MNGATFFERLGSSHRRRLKFEASAPKRDVMGWIAHGLTEVIVPGLKKRAQTTTLRGREMRERPTATGVWKR